MGQAGSEVRRSDHKAQTYGEDVSRHYGIGIFAMVGVLLRLL